jgi:hypothetical protein
MERHGHESFAEAGGGAVAEQAAELVGEDAGHPEQHVTERGYDREPPQAGCVRCRGDRSGEQRAGESE